MFCETRWSARSVSITIFKDSIFTICICLQRLDSLPGSQRDERADGFLRVIQDFSFVVTLCIMDKPLSQMLLLSIRIQEQTIDMHQALESAKASVRHLENLLDSAAAWDAVYEEALEIATKIGIE